MKLSFSFFTLFFLLPLACPAQNKLLDSLKKVVRDFEKQNYSIKDTNYTHTLVRLGDAFLMVNPDSAYQYAQKAHNSSELHNLLTPKANALRQMGLALRLKGEVDKSFDAYQASLALFEKLNNQAGKMLVYSQLGIVYEIQGKYPQALDSYFKALSLAEKLQDKPHESGALNNVGNIYKNQKNYVSALEYYERSLKIKENIGDKRGIGVSFNNIATVYSMQNDLEKALAYNKKSLAIKESLQDKRGICVSLGNIGELYIKQKNPQEALICFQRSLEIRETLGDKQGISVSQNNISLAYKELGEYDKALDFAQKALKTAQEAKAIVRIGEAMTNLAQIYEIQKDYNNALKFNKLYQTHKDSLFNIDNEKKLAQLSVEREKFEKEAEIRKRQALQKEKEAEHLEYLANTEKDKRLKDSLRSAAQNARLYAQSLHAEEARLRAESKFRETEFQKIKAENALRQTQIKEAEERAFFRTIINFLMFVGLVSIGIFSYFIYRGRQKEKKAKEKIQQINGELHTTIEQVKEYSEVIEEKNKHITASIQYAQRIQQAILPLPEEIQKHLPESFILFKPRDIVSGDFYYFHEQDGKLLLAVIDCTGHGVPGAFMTMIGYEILNEIILNKQISSPEAILYELHKSIRKALKQAETNNKDGMDLSLVLIDKNTKKLEFAGAKNSMLYIQRGEIAELKADKMPIGGEQREAERLFTKQTLDISLPTTLFMFTDGYQDQFGGEKKQKFRIAQMKQLFLEHHTKAPQVQCEIYEKTIDEWMKTGNEKQIDDILLMGVCIV